MESPSLDAGIFSDFGGEPDLAWLVELFVAEMPERTRKLTDLAEQRDWEGLARCAHQIKGSAGSYGFADITPYAQKLEIAAKGSANEEVILRTLHDLISVCQRARAGANPQTRFTRV